MTIYTKKTIIQITSGLQSELQHTNPTELQNPRPHSRLRTYGLTSTLTEFKGVLESRTQFSGIQNPVTVE